MEHNEPHPIEYRGANLTVQRSMRLPPDLYAAVRHIAVAEERKVSDVIRRAVRRYVEQATSTPS
jgi:predicted transcriptional regulator